MYPFEQWTSQLGTNYMNCFTMKTHTAWVSVLCCSWLSILKEIPTKLLSLTCRAEALGWAIWSGSAGGVVQTKVVLHITGVVGQCAEWAGEERRAGAGELTGVIWFYTQGPIKARRWDTSLYILSTVRTSPAMRACATERKHLTLGNYLKWFKTIIGVWILNSLKLGLYLFWVSLIIHACNVTQNEKLA